MQREKLAVQVHTHGNALVTADTLNRVKKHLTDNTIIICDRVGYKEINSIKNETKVYGVYHNHPTGPYRNQIIGLDHLYRKYPNCLWYGNIEWDTAVNNDQILKDLGGAEEIGAWTAGFDMREYDADWRVLSSKIKRTVDKTRYYIGCCLFFHRDFIKICLEENFFVEILRAAKVYGPYWPDYHEWSVDEAILPSIARSYGKPGFEFGSWKEDRNRDKYAVRFKPDWDALPDGWCAAHPLKDMTLRNQ